MSRRASVRFKSGLVPVLYLQVVVRTERLSCKIARTQRDIYLVASRIHRVRRLSKSANADTRVTR